MANLKEESRWEEGVYQFETSDPVQGGPDGVDNVPTKQLANRTRYLKDRADAADKAVGGLGNSKLDKSGGALSGALLGKPGAIAGNNPKNVGYGFDGDPDTGMFSPADGHLQLGANGVPYVVMLGNNLTLNPGGFLLFNSGGAERGRFTPAGRLLLGTTDDNGRDGMQVAYRASFAKGVQITDLEGPDGGHLRMTDPGYGVMFRHDGMSAYFLQTKKGDPLGTWNTFRPFAWSLDTGYVTIDGTGLGTKIGGQLSVGPGTGEGQIRVGAADGYFYGNATSVGWWGGNAGSFQFYAADGSFRVNGKPVWHSGNLTPFDLNVGGTSKGTLSFAPGARIFLSEGTPQNPSLTFDKDGAPDTGLYHIADGEFGVTCNGLVNVRFTANKGTIFDRAVQVPTPAAGDRSGNAASTAFVADAIASASIGQIIFEARTAPRAGCLALNGAALNRADYPALWAYAQGSGALVEEKDWSNGNWGSFSTGDGAKTFRIPEFRGEGIRCADSGRGADAGRRVGTWQDSQNRSHAHGASAEAVGDHAHSAWTDSQGWHGHHGWTAGAGGHNHNNGIYSRLLRPPYNGSITGSDTAGSGAEQAVGNGDSADIVGVGDHAHEFNTEGAGTHGHNVGIGAAGAHSHTITVAADGGAEARMRNVAVLAMIRAF
ncbi:MULTISPECIES: phage tail protein [Burkholderia]|uniref:Tail fiber protein n=2 Tax=Burkholderia cepacia complex TaxID=87882 RepID=A0A8A8CY87_9BURK|nr:MULTISPECIES: phage tail protein [Burkholderia cepacia complex]MCO8421401.1 tail fiber protein [Burkholderia cenocepacia]MCO8471097.1 tail fiber protein [Burkholderia cenocepacia]MCO8476427.1 tail fiber protein [Burkholderia cenocepacia]MCO8486654.1 tail fiber protein [Burkholderia cenocepacia]MCO8502494.1 tail fiber protein [Burkholderia cenocepacia]